MARSLTMTRYLMDKLHPIIVTLSDESSDWVSRLISGNVGLYELSVGPGGFSFNVPHSSGNLNH